MKKKNTKSMNKTTRHRILFAMLLLISSATMAQTNGQFVIKIEGHYMAHSGGAITDVTTFDPATCLWTSDNTYSQGGTNKNYYYMDGTTPRFLSAPTFAAGGALSLSNGLPTASMSVPESPYYFYKWDGGLGRGVQYYGACTDSTYCVDQAGHSWGDGQCWDVFWVAYLDNTWKLSDNYYNLNSVPTGGKFYPVTITEHPQETTIASGAVNLQGFELEYQQSQQVNPSIPAYTYSVRPAYTTYLYEGTSHHFYGEPVSDHTTIPGSTSYGPVNPSSYSWSITGDGAQYLSIDNNSIANPTISYNSPNNDGHTTATLTLTVTYAGGATQTSSTTILVKTPCQNPTVLTENTEVTYVGVTVSWVPTAESYKVSWQKQNTSTWEFAEVGNVTSYTITGLEYNSTYTYKVQATSCTTTTPDPSENLPTFTTLSEPGLMITGAIFGGGRMANVGGKTEVVVVNCDSIGAVFGGNDIAGTVEGNDGSSITLGVDAGGTYASYGITPNNGSIRVGSVYGGGNGYYAYNGSTFAPATSNTCTVSSGGSVTTQSQTNDWNEAVWTYSGSSDTTLTLPSITKTYITVTNNKVKVDSIFGGAKNAFVPMVIGQNAQGNNIYTNDSILINGGTILAVYGGNNIGGGQGYGLHTVTVNATTINLTDSIVNTATTGYGRDFGIRNLFGGGNKVAGSTTDVHINGGQIDNVFAGGNSADVHRANVTVNCAIGTNSNGDGITFNKLYSNAITYNGSAIIPKTDYGWNGVGGIYNVRTLYGGNNEAEMARVPTMTLTSGSVGTVYGGGNAGDMMGNATDDGTGHALVINGNDVQYGTHVVMNSASFIADYLYGGCRRSNVANSTWVELKKGHVGTVYGGCNISGDVGSTRVNVNAPTVPTTLAEQEVKGGTYVVAGGSNTNNIIVYKNLFAGSNGYYDCSTDGIHYISDEYFDDPTGQYEGLEVPTHNETNVVVSTGATIKGNVYAGGNLASVGFDDGTGFTRGYPELIGLASVRMDGGLVEQNVYGGGNMASIFGKNEVMVTGGTIRLGLYGGNDRAGQVAEKTNRIMPDNYNVASDGKTSLTDLGVNTYVGVSGNAQIGTVYGGGNGDYPPGSIHYCHASDNEPIQSNTFVDVHINGGTTVGTDGGHIGTVYGGGNGVTIRGGATVFLNIQNPVNTRNHVDTIFGGNNKGDLVIVPDVLLLHGQVGTVYGGCNQGAMTADANIPSGATTVNNLETVGGYTDIGSYVYLRNTYQASADSTHTVDAKVSEAVYGGCRRNGVTRNSLVLVEGGNFDNTGIFGGSDISGTVQGISRVALTGGTVGNVHGGGNGNYDYTSGPYQGMNPPYCAISRIDMFDGSASNLYAGGNACGSGATVLQFEGGSVANGLYGGSNSSGNIDGNVEVNIVSGTLGSNATHLTSGIFGGGYGPYTSTSGDVDINIGVADAANAGVCPVIFGDIYGGSALGSVNNEAADTTSVNFLNGTLHGTIYGGGLGDPDYDTCGRVFGVVTVNISNEDQASANCFIDLRDADIYGCNNTNGSPQDDVLVNIWKTGYTTGDYASQTGALYAIDEVFGGGNQADYLPENKLASSTKKATVYIHECLNSIRRVFGGGNAADATGVVTTIEGGRFDYIFGGGNGEVVNTAANIGQGGTHLVVEAGNIHHLFGGSNERGRINGETYTEVNGDNYDSGCNENIEEFFGGGNLAPITGTLNTTIACGAGTFGEVYGGSKLAAITGNVTLNIQGGAYNYVYGGSKGAAGTAANITGKVTLNLEGGIINYAFGGSNVNGNITDTIVVNVIDYELANCGLQVDTIFGGSNLATYNPTDATITSPIVNVVHVKDNDGVTGSVFGGGNQAEVSSNAKVNIGYDATTMAVFLPEEYRYDTLTTFPKTYVSGNVFGGGNEAGVGSTLINMYNGTVMTGMYGGCNTQGTVAGNSQVNVFDGTLGAANNTTGVLYGGGLGQNTKVSGDVAVAINGAAVTVNGDVYGGSAKGLVNCTDPVSGDPTHNGTSKTEVTLTDGTINGNLYGGGHGLQSASANVYGPVTVSVDGGTIVGSVFGGNNLSGSPLESVTLNVTGGTMDSIFGGGNQAPYTSPLVSAGVYSNYPEMNISGGTVTHKVVGGGNAAGINGSPQITISGGTLCNSSDYTKLGIYGGCNASGTVTGNVVLNIYGDSTSMTTIGTLATLNQDHAVGVFGGGYGSSTGVTGSVYVNYGIHNSSNPENRYPLLYGDLYGGSALGSVNDGAADSTNVNIMNGSIRGVVKMVGEDLFRYGGNIYGGGLGNLSHAALVNGKVHVNVGGETPSGDMIGKASLLDCDIYGCNNVNGSPQQDVFVDVYQTSHTPSDSASFTNDVGRTYAMHYVFGGGNKANYHPEVNTGWVKKTHTYMHGCDNTAEIVYAGGNAADCDGVVITVDGGRYNYVFAGGNGEVIPANIAQGGSTVFLRGGLIGWYFNGCNLHGDISGPIDEHTVCEGPDCCDTYAIEKYFFGANEATDYNGIESEIECGDNSKNFKYVYAGSRLAVVYGDIKLTVRGGEIGTIFGGSEGNDRISADVKKYPESYEDIVNFPEEHQAGLRQYFDPNGPDYAAHALNYGKGGNIILNLEGGTIGNVFGGCDYRGKVEGDIIITIDSNQVHPCELNLNYVYGGNNLAEYRPINPNRESPQVLLKSGHVNGAIYGGSMGGSPSHPFGNGKIVSNPTVVIGDKDSAHPVKVGGVLHTVTPPTQGEGNVYGGGRVADVQGDTKVIIQNKVNIKNNVYGGGQNGEVDGNAKVIIQEPDTTPAP